MKAFQNNFSNCPHLIHLTLHSPFPHGDISSTLHFSRRRLISLDGDMTSALQLTEHNCGRNHQLIRRHTIKAVLESVGSIDNSSSFNDVHAGVAVLNFSGENNVCSLIKPSMTLGVFKFKLVP